MFYSLQDNYNTTSVNNVETNSDIMGEVITEVNSDVENIQVQDISKSIYETDNIPAEENNISKHSHEPNNIPVNENEAPTLYRSSRIRRAPARYRTQVGNCHKEIISIYFVQCAVQLTGISFAAEQAWKKNEELMYLHLPTIEKVITSYQLYSSYVIF